ncbi:pneumococcal-type histidine triad protein [Streptococcus cameli]
MKKKYIISSAAAILLSVSSYQMGRFHEKTISDEQLIATIKETVKKEVRKQTPHVEQVSAEDDIDAEQIVVKITDSGYVTSHGDHFHYYDGKVPYDAIISEELVMKDPSYVLNDSDIVNEVKDGYIIKVKGQYYLYLKDKNKASNVRSKDDINRQKHGHSAVATPAGSPSVHYQTSDGYVFDPNDVIEDLGDGFLVPHGDHTHYIPKSQLTSAQIAAAMAVLQARGAKTAVPAPIVQPIGYHKPPKVKQPTPTKRVPVAGIDYPTSDGFLFDGTGIQFHTASGIVVKHGHHQHFLPYSGLIGTKWAYLVPASFGGNPTTPSQPAKPVPTKPSDPAKPSEPSEPTPGDEPVITPEIEEKLVYLANLLGIKRSNLKVMNSEKGLIAVWRHGDHDHVYLLSDIVIGKKISTGHDTPEEIEAKRRYISETYGVPLEAIKVKDNFFVFNEPTQQYDPTHIHPFLLPKDLVEVPVVTGDPETDFENELLAIAKHRGMKPTDIRIENGKFVVPHLGPGHGHTHYLNIKAIDGMKAYLSNKLPAITGGYVSGQFDKEAVLAKIKELEAEAETLLSATKPKQYRRVMQALTEFKAGLDELVTNSTAGYLKMLEEFRQTQILGAASELPPVSNLDKLYFALLDDVRSAHIAITEFDKNRFVEQINKAYEAKNAAELHRIQYELAELKRFDSRTNVTAIQYLDYFTSHIASPALSNELREKVAGHIGEIYRILDRKMMEGESFQTLVKNWIATKIEIDIAKVKRQQFEVTIGQNYQGLLNDPHVVKSIQSFIKTFSDDFNYNGSMKVPNAVVEPYGKPLSSDEEPKLPFAPEEPIGPTQPTPDPVVPVQPDPVTPAPSPTPTEGTVSQTEQEVLMKYVWDIQDRILEKYTGKDEEIGLEHIANLMSMLAAIQQANYGQSLDRETFETIKKAIITYATKALGYSVDYPQTSSPTPAQPNPTTPSQPTQPVNPTPAPSPAPTKTPWTQEDMNELLTVTHTIQMQIVDHFEKEEDQYFHIAKLQELLAPIQVNQGRDLSKEDLKAIQASVVAYGKSVLEAPAQPTPADDEPIEDDPFGDEPVDEEPEEPGTPMTPDDQKKTTDLTTEVFQLIWQKFEDKPELFNQYSMELEVIILPIKNGDLLYKEDLETINQELLALKARIEALQ